jgi:hypothetical protein
MTVSTGDTPHHHIRSISQWLDTRPHDRLIDVITYEATDFHLTAAVIEHLERPETWFDCLIEIKNNLIG